jgi:uncharacterized BrkB/YihY/UPF0761 family membrane protein
MVFFSRIIIYRDTVKYTYMKQYIFELIMAFALFAFFAGAFLLGYVEGSKSKTPEENDQVDSMYKGGLSSLFIGIILALLSSLMFFNIDTSYVSRKVLEKCGLKK